ncbi:MAG: hypothetical protein WCP12_15345 [bacterium]
MKQMMQSVKSLIVALTCATAGMAGAADFAIQVTKGHVFRATLLVSGPP